MNSNQPFSEQYRIAAKDWVAKKAARDLLRNTYHVVLGQLALRETGNTITEKKMKAMQTPEWAEHLQKGAEAEEATNLAEVKVVWIKMKHWEEQSANATARAERRM